MQNSLHPDANVPKIRIRPSQISDEEWRRFVVGQFSQLTPSTHRLEFVDLENSPNNAEYFTNDAEHSTNHSKRVFDVVPIANDSNHSLMTHRVLIRGTDDENNFGDNECDCDAFRYGIYGVCPHILFAVSQMNLSQSSAKKQSFSEIFLRHGLRREIVFSPSDEIPRIVLKAAKSCFNADGTLRQNDYQHLKTVIQRAAECRHELKIDGNVFAHLALFVQQQERAQKISALFKRGAQSQKFDSLLAQPLAAYQRGAAIQAAVSGRFLLFDSSGLGKRRTAIAASEILAETSGIQRVLILTHTSTLQTWHNELRQSLPQNCQTHSATTQIIFGNPAKRAEQYGANIFYNVARYDDFKTDADAIVSRMRPDLVILDASHTLKRYGAETARMIRRLESEFLFVLSNVEPSKIPGAFMSFVDMIDRQRIGLLESFLRQHQQFDAAKNQVRYVEMRHVAKTLPQHFRRFEAAEYRRSLAERILRERYLPINETQAKHHADLQNQWFRLITFWKNAILESRKPAETESSSTPNAANPTNENNNNEKSTTPQNISSNETSVKPKHVLPIVVPLPTLQKIQSLTEEMLSAANNVGKIETMYDLLLEHFEQPYVKAVVFSRSLPTLRFAAKKLSGLPFDCGLIDRFTPLAEQKNLYEKFHRDANCRVLFLQDGVSERLIFRQTQLAVDLDVPLDFKQTQLRRTHFLPHDSFRPCHIYSLISFGTIEHWLAKLQHQTDFPQHSVTLMTEQERIRFFDFIIALSEQVEEGTMVV